MEEGQQRNLSGIEKYFVAVKTSACDLMDAYHEDDVNGIKDQIENILKNISVISDFIGMTSNQEESTNKSEDEVENESIDEKPKSKRKNVLKKVEPAQKKEKSSKTSKLVDKSKPEKKKQQQRRMSPERKLKKIPIPELKKKIKSDDKNKDELDNNTSEDDESSETQGTETEIVSSDGDEKNIKKTVRRNKTVIKKKVNSLHSSKQEPAVENTSAYSILNDIESIDLENTIENTEQSSKLDVNQYENVNSVDNVSESDNNNVKQEIEPGQQIEIKNITSNVSDTKPSTKKNRIIRVTVSKESKSVESINPKNQYVRKSQQKAIKSDIKLTDKQESSESEVDVEDLKNPEKDKKGNTVLNRLINILKGQLKENQDKKSDIENLQNIYNICKEMKNLNNKLIEAYAKLYCDNIFILEKKVSETVDKNKHPKKFKSEVNKLIELEIKPEDKQIRRFYKKCLSCYIISQSGILAKLQNVKLSVDYIDILTDTQILELIEEVQKLIKKFNK